MLVCGLEEAAPGVHNRVREREDWTRELLDKESCSWAHSVRRSFVVEITSN